MLLIRVNPWRFGQPINIEDFHASPRAPSVHEGLHGVASNASFFLIRGFSGTHMFAAQRSFRDPLCADLKQFPFLCTDAVSYNKVNNLKAGVGGGLVAAGVLLSLRGIQIMH